MKHIIHSFVLEQVMTTASFLDKMNKFIFIRTWALPLRRYCSPASGATPPPSSNAAHRMTPRYSPSEFQKFILVWTKKYKSKADIPTFVSPDVIDRSRSEARIKIANVLMLLTALASFGAILSGKAAAKRGESVQQINADFHKKYREDYEKQQAVTEK